LTIGTRFNEASREVEISVADTGVGIPEEEQQLIFEPFFTTKRGSGGTGLGLATVYGIVDALGGHVDVHSRVANGTRFVIRLPAAAPALITNPHQVPAPGARRGTETLLLVEDEPGVREPLRRALERFGYTVFVAADGEDALRRMTDDTPTVDLLITDVVMPGLNGPDLVQRVRSIQPDMRVLYISGYVERSLTLLGAPRTLAGSDEDGDASSSLFLQKPFSPEQLAAAVRALLGASATTKPAHP
jgi:two-component system cell cycle sensor histidine kinase/response regulator CckA